MLASHRHTFRERRLLHRRSCILLCLKLGNFSQNTFFLDENICLRSRHGHFSGPFLGIIVKPHRDSKAFLLCRKHLVRDTRVREENNDPVGNRFHVFHHRVGKVFVITIAIQPKFTTVTESPSMVQVVQDSKFPAIMPRIVAVLDVACARSRIACDHRFRSRSDALQFRDLRCNHLDQCAQSPHHDFERRAVPAAAWLGSSAKCSFLSARRCVVAWVTRKPPNLVSANVGECVARILAGTTAAEFARVELARLPCLLHLDCKLDRQVPLQKVVGYEKRFLCELGRQRLYPLPHCRVAGQQLPHMVIPCARGPGCCDDGVSVGPCAALAQARLHTTRRRRPLCHRAPQIGKAGGSRVFCRGRVSDLTVRRHHGSGTGRIRGSGADLDAIGLVVGVGDATRGLRGGRAHVSHREPRHHLGHG
mmetsp:Transcript_8516/g.21882  ORF Transcript_8516/g.21882 Transcript_8516/m.21882 type:complete len:420 (+) Transcript_8516:756-2015(+)